MGEEAGYFGVDVEIGLSLGCFGGTGVVDDVIESTGGIELGSEVLFVVEFYFEEMDTRVLEARSVAVGADGYGGFVVSFECFLHYEASDETGSSGD